MNGTPTARAATSSNRSTSAQGDTSRVLRGWCCCCVAGRHSADAPGQGEMDLQIDDGIDETTIGVLKIGENHVRPSTGSQPPVCGRRGANRRVVVQTTGASEVGRCNPTEPRSYRFAPPRLTFDVINDEYPVINIPWISIVPGRRRRHMPPPRRRRPPPFPPNQTPIWRRPCASAAAPTAGPCAAWTAVTARLPGRLRIVQRQAAAGQQRVAINVHHHGRHIRAGMCCANANANTNTKHNHDICIHNTRPQEAASSSMVTVSPLRIN